MNEGATKGILVSTADYGPDAYNFAKDKPLTLLNGIKNWKSPPSNKNCIWFWERILSFITLYGGAFFAFCIKTAA